ncbi:transcriptional activator [Fimbriimonas ginsengisoli Gsoil 348]|uniref:Transcriptional activator n=1 Tax=Fimbriimonas ginsengisoli Gsoil 348 TaxID=661478 RepID=A0A068NQE3_FIMGI|nr:transcriptional activator [Fimbriimonas ginsengisoli Gsoil 348]
MQAQSEEQTITRFRTRRVGLLLAFLAYYEDRSHSRDELAEMLWPESEPDPARRNLRQALSSLRRHLEPPSVPAGAVLVAKQGRVSLNPGRVTTDVSDFKSLVRSASAETSGVKRLEKLKQAVALYRGDFLPGYYEEWVQGERLHLEDLLVSALQNLIRACEAEGEIDEAIRYVRIALAKDHLKEDLHATLMRLYLASERPASALQHFQEWTDQLARELSDEPSAELKALADRAIRQGSATIESAPGRAENEVVSAPPSPARQPSGPIVRLPVQLTRFFGRSHERDRAIQDLAESRIRLVTLWGPAGTGKTRLSIEVGRQLSEARDWNVWFASLADISAGSMVLDAVLTAMRLRNEAGNSPIDLLRANLSGPKNLVILDNLEHVLEEAMPVVELLLHEIPNLSILATSRQSLKLAGEQEIDLAALPVPPKEELPLSALTEVPSVQLFVSRAQSILPDFQLTPNNALPIAEICRRLDGLPLALEIAAGLSNAFTPSQLLQNLENRLELLRSRRRDLSIRHRSLRAAIDYSYDLLAPELQRFFLSLSVFRGGFTIEAADKICLPSSQRQNCLRMVLDLQERSLLRSEESGEGAPARFRLLESFREYGAELLDAEEELALRSRHAAYFLAQGKGSGDQENQLAALRFYFEQGQYHECVVLLEGLHGFSLLGQETIQALVRLPDFDRLDPLDRIMLLRLLANAHLYPSEFEESYRVSQRALEIAVQAEREDQIAICHRGIAVAAGYLGRRDEAIAHTERFLCYAERVGDLRMIEHGYNAIGSELWAKGDFAAALKAFDGAQAAASQLYGSEPPWPTLYNVARVYLDSGRYDDGMQIASEGLRIAQKQGDEFGISMCLSLVGRYHRLRGSLVAALATSHEVLVRRRRVGFLFWALTGLLDHASILIAMDRHRDAATLLAASRGVTKQQRFPDDRQYAEGLAAAKAGLSERVFEQAWAEGLAMNMEEAFRFALQQS